MARCPSDSLVRDATDLRDMGGGGVGCVTVAHFFFVVASLAPEGSLWTLAREADEGATSHGVV